MNSKTRICTHCNSVIQEDDDAFYVDGELICSTCADKTTTCEHCGERIWNDDSVSDNCTDLCQRCYDRFYTRCCECDAIIHVDNAHYLDDDDDAFCDSCYNKCELSEIHEYSYKPNTIFYGDGDRYFGVELEIDSGGKLGGNAIKLLEIGNPFDEQIYIKTDGSFDDSLEIVSHPMMLEYHKAQMPWGELMKTAVQMHYRSHKTTTCGLHIHINRTAFGDTCEIQDESISRVLYFIEHHWTELLKFSRRTEAQMNQWAARYGFKADPQEVLETAKKSSVGRYACVNLTNWSTIEFRMFRGMLKLNTFIAALELVNLICDLAINSDDKKIQQMSWTGFVEQISADEYPELITYLKERRLYINEKN